MVAAWEKKFHTLPKLEDNLQINFTELTFIGMKSDDEGGQKSGQTSDVTSFSPVKLTERQQVILGIIHRFVVEHVVEGVVEAGVEIPSALSIAKQIDTSSRTVQRELAYLQAQGIIRRVGADFSGHWEIIEK